MVGVERIADEFNDFTEWLRDTRSPEVQIIQGLANGFEGWIKLEFYLWLTTHRSPPLLPTTTSEDEGDVGLEYKFRLDKRFKNDQPRKQCDIWVRSSAASSLFHYVELKAPFLNRNTGKMFKSAASDFVAVSQIQRSHERPASGSIIILGVGFDDPNWNHALEGIRAHPKVPKDVVPVRSGHVDRSHQIRWSVFTKAYL